MSDVRVYRKGGVVVVDPDDGQIEFVNEFDITIEGNKLKLKDLSPIRPQEWLFTPAELLNETGEQVQLLYNPLDYLTSLNKKNIDATIQDSDSPIFIIPMTRSVVDTTLSVQAFLGDRAVTVADPSLLAVGQQVSIFASALNRFTIVGILGVSGSVITLDTPLDCDYPVGTEFVSGNRGMSVDGSVTPVVFGLRNPNGAGIVQKLDVTKIIFKILTDGNIDLSKFGDIIGGLENGVVLRKVSGGSTNNIVNLKTNGEIKSVCYDLDVEEASGNAQDGLTARLDFGGQSKMGAVIRLGKEDDLQLIVQDDLTSLGKFIIIAEGSFVTDI